MNSFERDALTLRNLETINHTSSSNVECLQCSADVQAGPTVTHAPMACSMPTSGDFASKEVAFHMRLKPAIVPREKRQNISYQALHQRRSHGAQHGS